MSRVLQNKGNVITQHYGNKGHSGVDVVGTGHTADYIVAHSDGKVIWCQKGQGNNPGSSGNLSYGNCVKIKHNNGYYTLYAHLQSTDLCVGQIVKRGQVLGYMGNSGNSYGTHLHFEVFNQNNQRINPEPYLDADLPGETSDCTGTITYQVYSNGRWYEEVNKCDSTANGYAGDGVNFISGLRAKPQYGEIIIQSHQLNGSWLSEINSKDYVVNDTTNGNSYSGIYGQPIDAVKIRSTKGYVDYRVKTKKGWLPWVHQDNDYAGNFGEPILGIQMK